MKEQKKSTARDLSETDIGHMQRGKKERDKSRNRI